MSQIWILIVESLEFMAFPQYFLIQRVQLSRSDEFSFDFFLLDPLLFDPGHGLSFGGHVERGDPLPAAGHV